MLLASIFVLVILFLSVICGSIFWTGWDSTLTTTELLQKSRLPDVVPWDEKLYHTDAKCQSPLFQPFRIGCPPNCVGFRPGMLPSEDNDVYRMTIAWNFASLVNHDVQTFRSSKAFTTAFLQANHSLVDMVMVKRGNTLHYGGQKKIHLNLAYLCCLLENETTPVIDAMHQWVEERQPFDFIVQFDRLECWHERFNSVTNIIVGDDRTQQTLYALHLDLMDYIRRHTGVIPTYVPRVRQMPFHITLGKFYVGEREPYYYTDTGHYQTQDDISPFLEDVYNAAASISQQFGRYWTGLAPMRVNFPPTPPNRYTPILQNRPPTG